MGVGITMNNLIHSWVLIKSVHFHYHGINKYVSWVHNIQKGEGAKFCQNVESLKNAWHHNNWSMSGYGRFYTWMRCGSFFQIIFSNQTWLSQEQVNIWFHSNVREIFDQFCKWEAVFMEVECLGNWCLVSILEMDLWPLTSLGLARVFKQWPLEFETINNVFVNTRDNVESFICFGSSLIMDNGNC